MLEDRIGAITRALVGVRHEYHLALQDCVDRLRRGDGWARRYAESHARGLANNFEHAPLSGQQENAFPFLFDSRHDKIGSISRRAMLVDRAHHGVLLDMVNRLNSKSASKWAELYNVINNQGLSQDPLCADLVGCLRRISPPEGLILPPTSGLRTFDNGGEVFRYIVLGPETVGRSEMSAPSRSTLSTNADVYEQVIDGTFEAVLRSLNRPRDKFFWASQDQAIQFVSSHPDWLYEGYMGTFFPFKLGRIELVASVSRVEERMVSENFTVVIHRFSQMYPEYAHFRHRFVLPHFPR